MSCCGTWSSCMRKATNLAERIRTQRWGVFCFYCSNTSSSWCQPNVNVWMCVSQSINIVSVCLYSFANLTNARSTCVVLQQRWLQAVLFVCSQSFLCNTLLLKYSAIKNFFLPITLTFDQHLHFIFTASLHKDDLVKFYPHNLYFLNFKLIIITIATSKLKAIHTVYQI